MVKIRDERIKGNLCDLYACANQYKLLFNYYEQHKNLKSEQEIEQRINYILKNKIKQKDEISTLLWVIGKNRKGD